MAPKAARRAGRKAASGATAESAMTDGEMTDGDAPPMAPVDETTPPGRQLTRARPEEIEDKPGNPLAAEMRARIAKAVSSSTGFAERWAMFWANHFAVEADSSGIVRRTVGPYEREAIRSGSTLP